MAFSVPDILPVTLFLELEDNKISKISSKNEEIHSSLKTYETELMWRIWDLCQAITLYFSLPVKATYRVPGVKSAKQCMWCEFQALHAKMVMP